MVGLKDFEMPSCCNSCSHWSFNRDDEPLCDLTYEYISQFDKRQADCPLVEAIPKADYETRLKADMVAVLEELKEQLREMHEDFFETEHFDEAYGVSDSMDVIQQKINELKEQTDEKD